MGLKDHELKWLTNHLGHTEKVHLTHYRATSGLIERLEIAKIMLLQEKNNVGKFAGVELADIQFQDLDGEHGASVSTHPTSETEIYVDLDHDDEPDDESEEEVAVGRRCVKKKAKTVSRVSWTLEEVNEIREYFAVFLEGKMKKSCPRMKDCLKAIALSKANGGQLAKRNWETIKKKVNHMAKKACSE